MAFLDFIKNRTAGQPQSIANKSQDQKPETAKEMYTREAAQEKAGQKPFDQMPSDQQAKVEGIKASLEKATQHIDRSAPTPSAAPTDGSGNREAMRQNMTGQDKTAPSLSPTSAQAGATAEKDTPAPSSDSSANTQEKERAQTMPRTRPSWER